MIDRPARTAMADSLRHLASGQLSNDEFEQRIPRSPDNAISGVYLDGAWYLYDDLHRHRLDGKYQLTAEGRREVARWILFLKSDLNYEWPPLFCAWRLALAVAVLLVLCIYPRVGAVAAGAAAVDWIRCRRIMARREFEIWPFSRRADLERAIANPPYCRRPSNPPLQPTGSAGG